MPFTTLEIYEKLVAKFRIKVQFDNERQYESLRTALVRQHRVTRDLLGLSDEAVCSSYKDNIGTFHIGVPAGKTPFNLIVSSEVIPDAE